MRPALEPLRPVTDVSGWTNDDWEQYFEAHRKAKMAQRSTQRARSAEMGLSSKVTKRWERLRRFVRRRRGR